jgi:hypothetical protein|tara:strand:- start:2517 stop:2681 length:165 start_codon:yes stop_codon:yes gene_type:complete
MKQPSTGQNRGSVSEIRRNDADFPVLTSQRCDVQFRLMYRELIFQKHDHKRGDG